MKQRRRYWFILLTGLLAGIQIFTAIRTLQIPPELRPQVHLILPLEFVVSGLWALIFAGVAVNLVRRQAPAWTLWAYIGFVGYSGVRLLFFAQSDYDQGRRPFVIMTTVLLLGIFAIYSQLR